MSAMTRLVFGAFLVSTTAIGGCAGSGASSGLPRIVNPWTGENKIAEIANPAELPTLPEHFHTRFSQLRPEMSLSEFRVIFPEAYFVKRQRVLWSDHPVDAYELTVRQRYRFPHDSQVYVQNQRAWFFFLGSSLESWGEPESWPLPPPDNK